jgi:sterol desaturase/sphingolipid hydroxylase (fatty acid hydroxylase superfamily)
MDTLLQLIEPLQSWIFEHLVLPAMFELGLMGWADQAFDATGTALLGMGEILLVYLLLRPLEWLRPVERWDDRRGLRVDVLYTFLNRSGLLPLLFFLLLNPLLSLLEVRLHLAGFFGFNLEGLAPYLGRHPVAAFLCYVTVIDFGEYVRHRLQHRFDWWWGLHSVHHSQRQLGLWADDRNHILDGLLRALWLAVLALIIGIPSEHFVGIVLLMRLHESLSHANVRLGFGALGDRMLVSPRFHRIHHGIGVGHEGRHCGRNFAVLLPVWDILFGTADFRRYFPATGIRDQLDGADYGRGFFGHQIDGLQRMYAALTGRRSSPSAPSN